MEKKREYNNFPEKTHEITHTKKPKKNRRAKKKRANANPNHTFAGCGVRLIPKIIIDDEEDETTDPPKTHSPSDQSDHHIYAEPLIRPIWGGCFRIYTGFTCTAMDGLSAYVSSKACEKVYNEAVKFPPVLRLDMLLKSSVWPKSFAESGPSDDHIAFYLFPSMVMEFERVYDAMVFDMISGNLALRAYFEDSELLIFTSVDLPARVSRFQGKIYLWGVLKGKMTCHPL